MSVYKSRPKVLLKISLRFTNRFQGINFVFTSNLMQIKSHLRGHPRSPKRGRDRCHPQECCYLRDLHQLLKLPWFFLENLELYNLQFYIHKSYFSPFSVNKKQTGLECIVVDLVLRSFYAATPGDKRFESSFQSISVMKLLSKIEYQDFFQIFQ